MKRGPRSGGGGSADMRSYAEKAQAAYAVVPDWVAELAAYTDAHGAKAAAKAISYSTSAVSTVLNNKADKMDLVRLEQMVRGALMGASVDCPVRGDMARDVCLSWQRKPYALSSSARVEMYHACRAGCPHSKLKGSASERAE
jgi:hypothetical protein